MIILKHIKVGDLSYVSQKDTQKTLQRGMKRAKINALYSQGFVPHMLTYSSTPLPLGTQSVSEYFGVECIGITADEFLQRYNASMPSGLQGLKAWECAKNPNVAGNVVASDYLIKTHTMLPSAINDILKSQQYIINTSKKGEAVQVDARPMIFDINVDGKDLWLRLATGNTNLRIDSFVKHLNDNFGCDLLLTNTTRLAQLAQKDNKFFDIEENF